MSPFMFDGDGEAVDARDVLDAEELADYQRARRDRGRTKHARNSRRAQQKDDENARLRAAADEADRSRRW